MTIKKHFTRLAIGGALLGAFLLGSAHADTTVQVRESSLGHGMSSGELVLPVGTNNWWGGFQNITVLEGASNNTFLAFCLDPFEYSSGDFTNYTKTTLQSSLITNASSDVVYKITQLFNYGYESALTSDLDAAAFQLALWEVANDDGDLTTGAVRKTEATNLSLVARTRTFLKNYANEDATSQYAFTFYKSTGNQDFISVSAVPETETFAMMLAGLGLMGAIARRRKNKTA
jgi:hypothetical protein